MLPFGSQPKLDQKATQNNTASAIFCLVTSKANEVKTGTRNDSRLNCGFLSMGAPAETAMIKRSDKQELYRGRKTECGEATTRNTAYLYDIVQSTFSLPEVCTLHASVTLNGDWQFAK